MGDPKYWLLYKQMKCIDKKEKLYNHRNLICLIIK